MDKDRWAAHFKKKMEDYSEPLPEGLWERLEAEMSSSPKVVPMWRMRRFAVAVAAALVVSVSVLTAWLAGFWAEELEQPDAVVAEKNTFPVAPDENLCFLLYPVLYRRWQSKHLYWLMPE